MTVSYCIERERTRCKCWPLLLDESTVTYTGKTLDLKVMKEPTVMALGMGAGGKIIQNIEPDHNDPRMWDLANSKLLNIHLIDSRTFKLVSNMDPPQKTNHSRAIPWNGVTLLPAPAWKNRENQSPG